MGKKTIKIKIPKEDIKVSTGHQNRPTGCGPHKDKRTRRRRTRADKNRKAIEEG